MIQTLREWIASILGTYEPVTYNVTQMANDPDIGLVQVVDHYVAKGLAGLDWEYVVTALVLVITIYSVFRLMGILLSALSGGRKW